MQITEAESITFSQEITRIQLNTVVIKTSVTPILLKSCTCLENDGH
jgi:hypothetical protein